MSARKPSMKGAEKYPQRGKYRALARGAMPRFIAMMTLLSRASQKTPTARRVVENITAGKRNKHPKRKIAP